VSEEDLESLYLLVCFLLHQFPFQNTAAGVKSLCFLTAFCVQQIHVARHLTVQLLRETLTMAAAAGNSCQCSYTLSSKCTKQICLQPLLPSTKCRCHSVLVRLPRGVPTPQLPCISYCRAMRKKVANLAGPSNGFYAGQSSPSPFRPRRLAYAANWALQSCCEVRQRMAKLDG
jgi:hypothetical protein